MSPRRIRSSLRRLPLLQRISAAAAGQRLYLTGGFLRDRFIGATPKSELDLTVDEPRPLLDRLGLRRGESFFLMDEERDTFRLVFSPPAPFRWVDITKMRAGSIEEDLLLRDFTVNALALDFRRQGADVIIDPAGGLEDLERRKLRHCSPRSFRDDPLRVLRGVRFEATLGFRIEGETLRLMAASRAGLGRVAAERVRDELFQILQGTAPVRGLGRIGELGLLRHWGPPFGPAAPSSLQGLRRVVHLLHRFHPRSAASRKLEEHVDQVATRRGIVVLAAFIRDRDAAGRRPALVRRLALGRRAEESLRICLGTGVPGLCRVRPPAEERAEMLDLFHAADPAVVEAVVLAASSLTPAASRKEAALAFLRRYRRRRRIFERPPLLSGKDALTLLPVAPGPALGELLRSTRRAQDLGLVRTFGGALRWARAELEQAGG